MIAVLVIMVDWFLPLRKSHYSGVVALACLAVAALLLIVFILHLGPGEAHQALHEPTKVFGERLILDPLGLLFTLFFTLTALATVLVSLRTDSLRCLRSGEYYALLMLATVAMSVVVASRDFLVLYLAIETVSLPSYVLVGYPRRQRLATEASLKYILYGAVASGVMLFGISYVYGLTGTTIIPSLYDFSGSGARLTYPNGVSGAANTAAAMGAMILILAGLGFKMALVPFHSWCPDVYEGAPTPITAFLAVGSKAAGFAALVRILYPLFCANATGRPISGLIGQRDLWTIFWLLSAATMTLGNLVAVWQTNVKRLLAYSSIAHAGYIAMAFTLMNREAFEAILIYFVVYFVMNLGAFFTVLFIENATKRCDLPAYAGLVRRSPLLVVVLTIFLLSLLGIPPTAGFMAKFKLFGALIQDASRPAVILAIVGIVNIVISAYYYLKVVKVMIFDQGEDESEIATGFLNGAILVVFAIAVFALFVFWTPVQRLAETIPLNIKVF
jgi:NADH-quinone oxidoreductase subunit N